MGDIMAMLGANYATWLFFGLALLTAELLMLNSYYLLWLAASAIITALVVSVVSISLAVQIVVFSVISGFALLLSAQFKPKVSDNGIVSRDQATIGLEGRISAMKMGQYNTLELEGSPWRVSGDFTEGQRVRVKAVNQGILDVEAVD